MNIRMRGAGAFQRITWRGGISHFHALALGLLFATCPGSTAAHVALPEQNLSSSTLVQGYPVMTTSGTSAFADWLSYVDAPRVGVAYAFSFDRGATWVHQSGFPLGPSDYGVGVPTAARLTADAFIHLATLSGPLQYFKGVLASSVVWTAPNIPLLNAASDFTGYHVTAIGCDESVGSVYIATTENYSWVPDVSYIQPGFRRGSVEAVADRRVGIVGERPGPREPRSRRWAAADWVRCSQR